MEKRITLRFWIIILLGVFFISGVLAQDSSVKTEFNIEGCDFQFEGKNIGVSVGACSREGSSDGRFYCGKEGDELIYSVTVGEGYGCAMGNRDFVPGSGAVDCCPENMYCSEGEINPDEFICKDRPENCLNQTTPGDCNDIGCIWLDITNKCSDGIRDIACGYYNTPISCEDDVLGLGQGGIGTELYGESIMCNDESFIIDRNQSGCEWVSGALSDNCKVKLSVVQQSSGVGEVPDRFECSNTYELGECIDGNQSVSWDATHSVVGDSFASTGGVVPSDCLTALNCKNGESYRFCGEPLIKLPGFSLFSLFVAFGIIGMVYFFRK